ncbi:MAG: extracellular solute-binding protein [Parvibaculaceae bacterium]
MKQLYRLFTAIFIVLLGASVDSEAKSLVLYTASNEQLEQIVLDAFKAAHPDITVESINMSTGPITQRLIAEKTNPQADVVWMINDIALKRLKSEGVLEPYEPKGLAIADDFRDPDGFYMGHDATIMAMAVNTNVLKQRNLPKPSDWTDLIKPVYKGQVSVASPTKSGTGLTIFTTFLDMFGWNYIDNLHKNIFQYADGGSAPVRQAVSGEIAIALSYDQAILQQLVPGSPIEMVTGSISPNIIEGAGLISGARNAGEGKLFLDWLLSKAGGAILGPQLGISAVPGYGQIDSSSIYLWEMRRPLDTDAFIREWSAKYEK